MKSTGLHLWPVPMTGHTADPMAAALPFKLLRRPPEMARIAPPGGRGRSIVRDSDRPGKPDLAPE